MTLTTTRYIVSYMACGNGCSVKRDSMSAQDRHHQQALSMTLDDHTAPLDPGLPFGRLLCVIGRVKKHCTISMFTTQRADPSWT